MDYRPSHLDFRRMRLAVLIAAMTPGLVLAAENKQDKQREDKQEKILDKVSKEAYTAVQEAGFARVAIFDGQVDQAKKLLEDARSNLAKAKQNAPTLTVSVKAVEKTGDKTIESAKVTETSDLLPIDASLALTEDYVATPEKTAKIKEANEHLKKGDHPKAIDVLKTAGIGVSVSRVLMPLQRTITHVDGALKLMKEGKYYEANLTLKGIEDGLLVDSVLLYTPEGAKAPATAKG